MRIAGTLILFTAAVANLAAQAQDANAGFDLRGTVSGEAFYSHELSAAPRDGGPLDGGFRAMLYPTLKLSSGWAISGAIQIYSKPYFQEEFSTNAYGVKGELLQLNLSYAHFWGENRSVIVRLGQLSSAFGAFIPRYDSADNPLIGVPSAYGYYYKPVTFMGLTGAQVDTTIGKLDARAQFVNSSPANPRTIFDRDQYGNWAGGIGYTILQGFRVGGSAYYGPYLDRHYPFFFPGEANPNILPGSVYGLDVEWGRGPWNVWGELQHFSMDYHAIPTFVQQIGYTEVRRTINPRWYGAVRLGYVHPKSFPGSETYEFAVGFRPNTHQLVKVGYQIQSGAAYPGTLGNTAALEFVTTFHAPPLALPRR